MKSVVTLLLLSMPLFATEVRMTSEDRTKLMNWLEESRKEFLAAIDSANESQWTWKSVPDRWSIGEVAEHVVLAEAALFANVKKALASPANEKWEAETQGKTGKMEAVLAPRLGRVQAPEPIVPKGGMTIAQVKERFETQRAEIVKFAKETELPLKQHTIANPFFGPLNAYQWLIYSPLHTMRHDKQIAEVKATAGYPR